MSEFLFLPGVASGTPSWAGAIRYNASDSSIYHWTGTQWVKSGATPTLQQVTAAGSTTTLGITALSYSTTSGRAQVNNAGPGGRVQVFDTDNVQQLEAMVVNNLTTKFGRLTTDLYVLKNLGLTEAPIATGITGGDGALYMRGDSLRLLTASGEVNLQTASGGGGASSTTLSTLTYGATTTWNYATQGTAAKVTLTGNTTLSITNLPASVAYLTLEVIQDATGSRTITLPAGTKVIGGGAGAVTLTTTGGATDILTFYYNGTTLYCNIGTNYN